MLTIVKFSFKIPEKQAKIKHKEDYLDLHHALLNFGLKETSFGYYEGEVSEKTQFEIGFKILSKKILMSELETLRINFDGEEEDTLENYKKMLKENKKDLQKKTRIF